MNYQMMMMMTEEEKKEKEADAGAEEDKMETGFVPFARWKRGNYYMDSRKKQRCTHSHTLSVFLEMKTIRNNTKVEEAQEQEEMEMGEEEHEPIRYLNSEEAENEGFCATFYNNGQPLFDTAVVNDTAAATTTVIYHYDPSNDSEDDNDDSSSSSSTSRVQCPSPLGCLFLFRCQLINMQSDLKSIIIIQSWWQQQQ